MRGFLLTSVLALALVVQLQAQQLPLFTQYMFDPYLINPSMVGSGGRSEVNALYRRQWTQIQDGPKTIQFDAQLPLNSKMAVGLNVYNDQSVLLSATSVLFTYGYKVLLARDHQLGFGLSAGIFSNRINLNGVAASDLNDPALLNMPLNNTSMNGQFGAHYKFKNFTLGYSLVNLVERKTFTPEQFQNIKFGALKSQIMYASYRFTVQEAKWYLQPNFAYRTSGDHVNYYEASGIVSYLSGEAGFDLGAGYRQNFGPSVMARISWKQLQVGFAYDFPANKAQVSTGGTQEVQVKWRFGRIVDPLVKKNSTSTLADSKPPVQEENPAAEKTEPTKEENQMAEANSVQPEKQEAEKAPATIPEQKTTPSVAETPVSSVTTTDPPLSPGAPANVTSKNEPLKTDVSEQKQDTPPQQYYYVIGTFESQANAQAFYNTARKKGVTVEIKESKAGSARHYYYVHMPKYKTTEISLDQLISLQKTTGYKEAWFTKIE